MMRGNVLLFSQATWNGNLLSTCGQPAIGACANVSVRDSDPESNSPKVAKQLNLLVLVCDEKNP